MVRCCKDNVVLVSGLQIRSLLRTLDSCDGSGCCVVGTSCSVTLPTLQLYWNSLSQTGKHCTLKHPRRWMQRCVLACDVTRPVFTHSCGNVQMSLPRVQSSWQVLNVLEYAVKR